MAQRPAPGACSKVSLNNGFCILVAAGMNTQFTQNEHDPQLSGPYPRKVLLIGDFGITFNEGSGRGPYT